MIVIQTKPLLNVKNINKMVESTYFWQCFGLHLFILGHPNHTSLSGKLLAQYFWGRSKIFYAASTLVRIKDTKQ